MTFDLASLREGWDFEAKLAGGRDGLGAVPASFFESYSAMANTDGGTIVLGARERSDGLFEVAGIVEIDRVEQDLWNQLDNRQKVSANVLRRQDVRREVVDGHTLLVIDVPRAERRARPVFLNGNPLLAWRRSGEGDRRCSEAEVRRMLADASDEPVDGQILEGFGIDDLDHETVAAWRNRFSARSPDHPFLAVDLPQMLQKIGAWRRDRRSGVEGLTVAGLLMFGQERAILDRFPSYQLDYRHLADDPAQRWIDRVTNDGTWSGNVFDFYRKVFPRLTDDLRVPFGLNEAMQRVDTTPVREALRESLLNALIHADYSGTRGIRIFRRRGGYELVNPGTLRVRWNEARSGNASDPRNPSLQKLFQLLGLGERAGSGVPRILQAWRDQHWRPPELFEDFDNNETRLVLSIESLLPEATVAELDARFGQRFRALSEAGRIAVVTAAAEGRVSNRRLQEVLDEHPRDLTYLLGDLVREGLLRPHGERSGRWYSLAEGYGAPHQASLFDAVAVDESATLQGSESSLHSGS
ncbi:MAG: putative DNA binding domain-containing protein, partial [Deltaproteobacteria bacterium]|nr:putative DNA binding domain-containing protein [Deltaproteobacteria bacterium]